MEPVSVQMAQMGVVTGGRTLRTVLGSCVAVVLRDPGRRVSGLAHVMLPRRVRDDDLMGKYADTAVPALLSRVVQRGGRAGAVHALLIGGARMFPLGDERIASIGDQNVEAARRALADSRIPIIFEDVGGTAGRTVAFDNESGAVSVHTLQALRTKGAAL